mmetsp:Transcript_13743/g.32552  ORF Transcript_13743/g.32552 Transcript_13743/m.32552 type:complete len:731 (-) Transcript_13743:290-2482(-)
MKRGFKMNFVKAGGGGAYRPGPEPAAPRQPRPSPSPSLQQGPAGTNLPEPKRKVPAERSWFDEESDDEAPKNAPRVGSEEVDPLDAFMNANAEVVEAESKTMGVERAKAAFLDEDAREEAEEVAVAMAAIEYDSDGVPIRADSDEEVEYDSDGVPIAGSSSKKKAKIEALPPVDHSLEDYEAFRRDFYTPHEAVRSRSHEATMTLERDLELTLQGRGLDQIRPLQSFVHCGFEPKLVKAILDAGFEAPTPIQCASLPPALAGRDLLALARTGSGKTLAYVWPMVVHAFAQRPLESGEGPIGLVLAPTRELVEQIYREVKRFVKPFEGRVVAVFGGGGKWEMSRALKAGAEVVVATPGRLMELSKPGGAGGPATNFGRVTMVVLDEADRMFDLGFEYQIQSILDQVRPARQTLLFSATFARRVEALAAKNMSDPVKVLVGAQGGSQVAQSFYVLPNSTAKWEWLSSRLPALLSRGPKGPEVQEGPGAQTDSKLLVFVGSKVSCADLAARLAAFLNPGSGGSGQGGSGQGGNSKVACLHGDMDQEARSEAVRGLKSGLIVRVLVATDVAARGLDVKGIKHVVNYEPARNIDSHVHRIGRTGRLGRDGLSAPGEAHTLLTPKDAVFAGELARHLRLDGKQVPPHLDELASSRAFSRSAQSGPGLPDPARAWASHQSGRPPTAPSAAARPTHAPAPSHYGPASSHASGGPFRAQQPPGVLGPGSTRKRSRWGNK